MHDVVVAALALGGAAQAGQDLRRVVVEADDDGLHLGATQVYAQAQGRVRTDTSRVSYSRFWDSRRVSREHDRRVAKKRT